MHGRASIVLTCFQVDLKRKDAEEELRKSKALSTLVAELSTVHSPRIEVTTILADFPAVFFHISHWYLSWNTTDKSKS